MVTKNKEFKRGSSEYDRMFARIGKLEQEVDLYKRVVKKQEKDMKKERQEKHKEYQIISTENVNLLAEVRTLKEEREEREGEI